MLRALGTVKHRVKNNPVSHAVGRAYRRVTLVEPSSFDTVYHCCTQKTASQWFRAIFSDRLFYRYTGLEVVPHIALGLREAHFDGQFPMRTIATHLYVDYPTYNSIPKPPRYRTFFVLRDPRDALVSWYFSMKYSHVDRFETVRTLRHELADMDAEAGISHLIRRLEGFGFFDAQRSWMESPAREDPSVRVMLYEDLASDNAQFLTRLLEYLDVRMPESDVRRLHERHSFRRMSRGREQGQEDINSHYRKGVAGDWRNYFTPRLENELRETTGDLLSVLGYE